jgi:2'-5' RNA ligase
MPEEASSELANLCRDVRGARWTDIGQMHLTLRFIGDVDTTSASGIMECLHSIRYTSFDLSLKGTGFFPPRRSPKILWAGVNKSSHLTELHDIIENALASTGIGPEERRFYPHITLARLNDSTTHADIIPFLSSTSLFRFGPAHITEFHLYSSTLKADGAVHTIEESYELY